MTTLLCCCGRLIRLGRWWLLAALLSGLCGCASWATHDEEFSDNEMSKTVRKARPEKNEIDYWSFSNKGRQIERDLNAQ